MRTLDRKIVRDAFRLRGQFLAIAVLIACGIAVFIMLRSMNGYLRGSQDEYYGRYGFGDVFAHATRAPRSLEARLAAIPGIERAYVRIVRDVVLDVPGLPEPATGRIVSWPDRGSAPLNRLHLRSGRLVEPGRRDQVVVSDAFAEANALRVGDTFGAVLNGRWQRLSVVGTAISPEFIYEVSGIGTVFPDNRRFGAMWMSEGALASAFDMDGAFNDVVATLSPGQAEAPVLTAIDELLDPFGGLGAYGRDMHLSHEFVTSEIEETRVTASFFPALFLLVTVFLLHTTLARLVRMEREQIGLLKAFGFDAAVVGFHYMKLALLPVAVGGVVGAWLGVWLADRMAGVYARFYQFPEVAFQLEPSVVGGGLAIAGLTGVVGALAATRSVVRLAPAVAMAPPSPPRFHRIALERWGWWGTLGTTARMIVRNVVRSRWKSASTVIGLVLALGTVAALLGMFDAIDVVADLQFRQIYRDDVAVYFDAPQSSEAVRELTHLPGVLSAEPIRIAPARLRNGHRERRTAIVGIGYDADLRRIVDAHSVVHAPPLRGVLMGRVLARKLGVRSGETIRLEIMEGRRTVEELEVAGLVDELMGGQVYVHAETLGRLLGESHTVSGALMIVDAAAEERLYARLKRLPGVSTVVVKDAVVEAFEDTIEESFTIALTSTVVLGVALVAAIVYNQTRVALSERGRELASLRVLGFSRREVARMLLGEQALLVGIAIPLGLLLGWFLLLAMMLRFDTELFRLPVVVRADTWARAAGLVFGSAVLAGLLVRRRLDRIDLIAVLKTRE